MSTKLGFAFSFTKACNSISANVVRKLRVVISPYVTKDTGSAGYHNPPHLHHHTNPKISAPGLRTEVYRDVKISNVRLTACFRVCVCAFVCLSRLRWRESERVIEVGESLSGEEAKTK